MLVSKLHPVREEWGAASLFSEIQARNCRKKARKLVKICLKMAEIRKIITFLLKLL